MILTFVRLAAMNDPRLTFTKNVGSLINLPTKQIPWQTDQTHFLGRYICLR